MGPGSGAGEWGWAAGLRELGGWGDWTEGDWCAGGGLGVENPGGSGNAAGRRLDTACWEVCVRSPSPPCCHHNPPPQLTERAAFYGKNGEEDRRSFRQLLRGLPLSQTPAEVADAVYNCAASKSHEVGGVVDTSPNETKPNAIKRGGERGRCLTTEWHATIVPIPEMHRVPRGVGGWEGRGESGGWREEERVRKRGQCLFQPLSSVPMSPFTPSHPFSPHLAPSVLPPAPRAGVCGAALRRRRAGLQVHGPQPQRRALHLGIDVEGPCHS